MKKLIVLSLAGIASLTLTHAGLAGGLGWGFHGGGFGGGGFIDGESRPTFSSLEERPSSRQPFYDSRANRSVTPFARSSGTSNRPRNHLASPSNQAAQISRPTSRLLTPPYDPTQEQPTGLNGRTDHVYQSQAAESHRDWDHRRAYYSGNHWWAYNGYDWIGLDHGFYPWDYYPYYTYDYYPYDYFVSGPTDVPPAYQGTTSSPPPPDPRVTAAQTELAQKSYYGGPIDGLFGPTMRDAVARYQMNQNLTVTGSLTPDTVQALGLSQVVTN